MKLHLRTFLGALLLMTGSLTYAQAPAGSADTSASSSGADAAPVEGANAKPQSEASKKAGRDSVNVRAFCRDAIDKESRKWMKDNFKAETSRFAIDDEEITEGPEGATGFVKGVCKSQADCSHVKLKFTADASKGKGKCSVRKLELVSATANGTSLWNELKSTGAPVKLRPEYVKALALKKATLPLSELLTALLNSETHKMEEGPVECKVEDADSDERKCFAVRVENLETGKQEYEITFSAHRQDGAWSPVRESLSFNASR